MELKRDLVRQSLIVSSEMRLPDATRLSREQANLMSINELCVSVEAISRSADIMDRDREKYQYPVRHLRQSLAELQTMVHRALNSEEMVPASKTMEKGLAKFSALEFRALATLLTETPEQASALLADIESNDPQIRNAALNRLLSAANAGIEDPETMLRIGEILSHAGRFVAMNVRLQLIVKEIRNLRLKSAEMIERGMWPHPLPNVPDFRPSEPPTGQKFDMYQEPKRQQLEAPPVYISEAVATQKAIEAMLAEGAQRKLSEAEAYRAVHTSRHDDFVQRIAGLKSRYPDFTDLINSRSDVSIDLFDSPATPQAIVARIEQDIRESMATRSAA